MFHVKPRVGAVAAMLAAIALVAAACGGGGDDSGGGAASGGGGGGTTKVRFLLPFNPGIAFYPVHLAKELGFFSDEKLDVTVESVNGSSLVVQQVAAGRVDAGLAASEAGILGFAQNPSLRSVYEVYTKNSFNLYVLESSPLRSIADFKGKVIGANSLEGGEALAARMLLRKNGMDPEKDLRIEAIGFARPAQITALQNGRIDGFISTWAPTAGFDVAGVKLRCVTCGQMPVAGTAMVVNDSTLQSKRDLVARIGRALSKAKLFAKTSPGAALEVMRKVSPTEFSNPALARRIMELAIDNMEPSADGYGAANLKGYQDQVSLMTTPGANSGLDEPIDVPSFVKNDLVAEYGQFDQQAVIDQAKKATQYAG